SSRTIKINGGFGRSDGWQDRTENDTDRGAATFRFDLGKAHTALDLVAYRDRQDWGSPLPFDAGALVPGFALDRNYAVGGAEVKRGEPEGRGREFDFDQLRSAYPDIPDADEIRSGGDREFKDRRTFVGLYVHDAWTPTWRLTLEGGGRFDATSEKLETEADLP